VPAEPHPGPPGSSAADPAPGQWKTLERRTILQHSKYLAVENHTVLLPDGQVIPDWPWVITPDYVNIVALNPQGEFICFRQMKYAVPQGTLAPAGGYIEPGESALQAAQRELLEETGCQASDWSLLGSFAVDANRGAGTAYLFLAQGAQKIAERTSDDLEEQQLVLLSRDEITAALKRGEFRFLSGAAAVALALQYLRDQEG